MTTSRKPCACMHCQIDLYPVLHLRSAWTPVLTATSFDWLCSACEQTLRKRKDTLQKGDSSK